MEPRRYVFKVAPIPKAKTSSPTKDEMLNLIQRMADLIDDWDASMGGDGKQPLVFKARVLIARARGDK